MPIILETKRYLFLMKNQDDIIYVFYLTKLKGLSRDNFPFIQELILSRSRAVSAKRTILWPFTKKKKINF